MLCNVCGGQNTHYKFNLTENLFLYGLSGSFHGTTVK
jgi:hypothetical protein